MMQVKVDVVKGKIVSNGDKVKDYFSSLDDGSYIISIQRVNPLITTRDYQKAYFDKVDIAVESTGNDRYTIHEEFKKHAGIETTTNLDIIGWRDLLKKFSWWAYNEMDVVV